MTFHSYIASLSLNSHKEVLFEHSLYPTEKPREEGYIQVSEVHNLFYATYGNPNGIPVVILHGGPGAGCNDTMSRFFDLTRWNVVMFDQRGAMRSEPFACMDENSPQHSIADIEVLRKHLGIEKWVVFGGSWGSTLAILYGQEYPQNCMGFILRGIFLGREQDYLHVVYGMGKVFPEAYEPFLSYIPEEERNDLLSAYYNRIIDPNPQVHMEAARTFIRFDMICSTHLPSPEALEKILQNDKLVLSMTKAFLYYSIHRFFLKPNQVLSQMHKITDLPAIIIHGRWDAIDLPEMAYSLHKKWTNSTLWMIAEGGHSANDPAIAKALATATDFFAEKMK
ncbi:MAG: Proline iminopeptidase [Chlamydiia bacterium]|nr:Proline iminopeptidase [Chlamydiia bacterium]